MSESESGKVAAGAAAIRQKVSSVFLNKMKAMLRRSSVRDLMVPLACSDDGIILTEDCHLGSVFVAPPMSGADDGVISRIEGIFNSDMPPGTVIQFSFMSSPDIEEIVGAYEGSRLHAKVENETPENLQRMVARRTDLFRKGLKVAPIRGFDCLVSRTQLIISVKFPIKAPRYTEDEIFEVRERIGQIAEGLRTAGIQVEQLRARGYVMLMRRLLDMKADKIPENFSENKQLKDQIVGAGDYLQTTGDRVLLNGNDIRVMSVKIRPEYTSLAAFAHLVGDPAGGSSQFNVPFMLTTTIHFPDRISTVSKIKANATAINYQAFGPMLKWSNLLAYKKEGHDTLVNDLDLGGTPVKVSTSIILFGEEGNDTPLNKQMGMVRSHYNFFEYIMVQEKFIALPVFLNCLPLYASAETEKGTDRSDTMGMSHAVHMLPVLGDWRGTGWGATMMLLSRRNQPMLFDLYDSSQSRNAVIFAEAGAGKSVLMQQIITDYLSTGQGTRAWIIDTGFSFYKLCKYLGGEFIELSDDSGVCLNPFTDIKDLDSELDYLKGIVAVMIDPNGLPAYELSRLEESIKATYGRLSTSMTITDVAEFLLNQSDPRLVDLGNMLFPFTRVGQYGRWFDGVNNLNMERNMVVLELAQLKSRPHLQKVVLFMLMNRIQHDMYLSGENTKKILAIDEAWEILKEGEIGQMMSAFYRKIRKEGGAAIIAVQSISDLYLSPAGRAIAENSPFKLVLSQRPETISHIEKEGLMGLDAYGYHCMRTLKSIKGKYSELLITSPMGYGVARLVVDRFAQVLYSSSEKERFEIMRRIREGEVPSEVIDDFIERNG